MPYGAASLLAANGRSNSSFPVPATNRKELAMFCRKHSLEAKQNLMTFIIFILCTIAFHFGWKPEIFNTRLMFTVTMVFGVAWWFTIRFLVSGFWDPSASEVGCPVTENSEQNK